MTLPLAELERIPTSAMSEDVLMSAYRTAAPITRICPCACGGRITAEAHDWQSITAAVSVHNESTRHRQWRMDNEE